MIGVDVNRNKYLLDGFCHRMSLSKRWQILRDTWKRWSRMPDVAGVFVGYERYGMQSDIEYFEERMQIEDLAFPIEELNWPREGQESKQHRIERLEPDFRMGRLRLPDVIDIDEKGDITPCDPRTRKRCQEVIEAGEPWRVASPIRKSDEDGKIYDVLSMFIEEYLFFPAAPHDDFLDAMSRIYDMEPMGPIYYEDEPNRENSVMPAVFSDGV